MEPYEQPGGNALVEAVLWLEGLLLGSIAVALATIAVAVTGFLMLQGRLAYRQGARVVVGCFILFGARPIATGLHGLSANAIGSGEVRTIASPAPQLPPPQPLAAAPSSPPSNDPFAGAAVPTGAQSCCD